MVLNSEIIDSLRLSLQKWREEDAKAQKEHRQAMLILELAISSGGLASFNPSTENLNQELKDLVERLKEEMAHSEKDSLDPATLRQLIGANIGSPELLQIFNSILDRIEAKQVELENKGIDVSEADSFGQLAQTEFNHDTRASVFQKALDTLNLNPVRDFQQALGSAQDLLSIVA